MNVAGVGSRLGRLPAGGLAADFVDAMSELASGVVLVTCLVDGRPWGTTVTAFQSVSAEPPIVLVSLETRSTSADAVARGGRFGIGVLAADHRGLARYASRRGASKYLPSDALADALAQLDCEVVDEVVIADHTVFFARVLAARSRRGGAPLVRHRRTYRTIREQEDDRHATQ